MEQIIARLKEPSTHNSIGYLLMAGASLFPQYATILIAMGSVFGINGMVMPEGQK